MRILMTGATGFVGRALAQRLHADDHSLVIWTRSPPKARTLLPEATFVQAREDNANLVAAMEDCDAIVHLAGENLFGARWNPAQKRRLEESRIGVGTRLVEAMKKCPSPPGVVVGTSAVGYYGDTEEECTEGTPPANDFLATLCVAWEESLLPARELGARVATLRVGVVLGRGGGALERMLPIFRLGLGGVLGSGRQPLSWIHLDDLVTLYARALTDPDMEGPFNATAPDAATNAELTRALGAALHRPTFFPVPASILRLTLGPAASVILGGQRALPSRLLERNHAFRHPTLESAIDAILTPPRPESSPRK